MKCNSSFSAVVGCDLGARLGMWLALIGLVPAVSAIILLEPLAINEVQPQNVSCLEDGYGELDPWLELYNPNAFTPVRLEDYFLSTNYANLARWRFPQGTVIGPGEFLVVWMDGQPEQTLTSQPHSGLRLSPRRSSVALSRLVNGQPEIVDFLDYDFDEVGPDLAYGYFPDGRSGSRQLFLNPTPGSRNLPSPLTVRINEWQVTSLGDAEGWFELYNPTRSTINLSGSFLSDEPGQRTKFRIPGGRSLPPKGFLRVWADNNPTLNLFDRVDLHVNFRLGSGFLSLAAPEGTLADVVNYPQLPPGAAQGRFPDGAKAIYTSSFSTPRGRNAGPPVIVMQPQSRTVVAGQDVVFSVEVSGAPPFVFEWSFNGNVIVPNGGPQLELKNVGAAEAGAYSVRVINQAGSDASRPATLAVLQPPSVAVQPDKVVVQPGKSARFVATATGTPPLTFQWRLNGVNIPGAADDIYFIPSAGLANGGTYEVVVQNAAGVAISAPAQLVLDVPGPPTADDFDGRVQLSEQANTLGGSNRRATAEPGEPRHAGKPGGRSVWYSWQPPFAGVATFETRGSTFDTLLAVYIGDRVDALREVASDDERGGVHTSRVQFNADPLLEYQIAVDGYDGAEGNFILSWTLKDKLGRLPVFLTQPESQTVRRGDPVTLFVRTDPEQLPLQWLRDGVPLPGQNDAVLVIDKVTQREVGFYSVQAFSGNLGVESLAATIEIGPAFDVQSQDKPADLFINDPSGAPQRLPGPGFGARLTGGGGGIISVSAGTIVSHTLSNTTNSVTDIQEVSHCGHVTAATRWLDFATDAKGTCLVWSSGTRTNGSGFDTLLAVYSITNLDELTLIACATNSAGGDPVYARFEAGAGDHFLAVVDGLNGDKGIIEIDWLLGAAPTIAQAPADYRVPEGDDVSFGIEAAGWIPTPAYQWRHDDVTMASANASSLTLTNAAAADGGAYSVVVSNPIGQVTNLVANVAVEIPLLVEMRTDTSPPGQARLAGTASQAFEVLTSTNLECWTPLLLISNVPFTLDQSVPLGPTPPVQFYRAEPWPVAPWDKAPACE